jgi:ATP-dependent RNA helicase RhlE
VFQRFGLPGDLERGIAALGFTEPTPVQEQAIPPSLAGRDVVGCAMTGTGKTAAFLIPVLGRLLHKPAKGTRALVLTPTRELAAQVAEHLRRLAAHTRLRGAAVYGGVAMGPQREAFRRGTDVLVATPGRLLDHLQYPYARLDGIETLVLDEADRMLDMGFLPAIHQILRRLPRERQTLLFSATMPPAIAALARELMRDPIALDLGRRPAPADGVSQAVYAIPAERKKDLLLALLGGGTVKQALVFTRTKSRADRLSRFLERNGVVTAALHGDRSQAQRTRALDGFRSGRTRVLVATDIAARGIDVEAISHVVNFDIPRQPDDYIHRVGRTARARAVGDAWTFVAPEEEKDLRTLERAIGRRLTRAAAPPHCAGEMNEPARPVGDAPARHGTRVTVPTPRRQGSAARPGAPGTAPTGRGRSFRPGRRRFGS